MFETPFAPPPAVLAEGEWVFRSRWPELLFREGPLVIDFHDHYFRTSDPTQVGFLLKIVSFEPNVEVWIRPAVVAAVPSVPPVETIGTPATPRVARRRTPRKRGH